MEAKIREEHLFMAQVFQQAERFDDMVNAMKNVIADDACLTHTERNMLAIAYKNAILPIRTARRVLEEVAKEENIKENNHLKLVKVYKVTIEAEICKYCREIIELIDNKLLQSSNGNAEAEIFYYKTKGNFLRYISECTEIKDKEAETNAEACYMIANQKMDLCFENCHVLRLSSALNLSLYQYDFKKDLVKACKIARQALQPLHNFENIPQQQYKQIILLLQMLRDNLTIWTTELQQTEGKCYP